jgi:DNA (cytosine-5)-methyltransferase 1
VTSYLSICSGIEATTVAWHPLGFRPLAFSEIEAFPRAVLGHHYPDVPCHGDFTALRGQPWIVDADILVGGTPCQAFSVAGLRNSLADDRGNLSLEFVRLADAIDAVRGAAGRPPAIIVWENVPGVLSVRDNAFGCFTAALAGDVAPLVPPRGKWTNAGVVDGPARTVAWRILDAQYFGLAQRRRRVFVVASARAGFDPAAVLLEFEGLRRDSPPRREAGKDAAGGPAPGTDERRSHWDGIEHPHPTLNQAFNTGAIGYSNQELFSQRGAGLVSEASTREIPHCLNADASEDLSPTLRAMPHHASHANGGGQMAVAIPINEVGKRTGPSSNDDPRAGTGIGEDGDPMFTLQAGARHGVAAYAFQPRIARNGRGDMGDIVNALNAQSGETGKGDAAPCVAVAFQDRFRGDDGRGYDRPPPLSTEMTGSLETVKPWNVATSMAVRRLTPVECERLQGFPDGYTAIPWRGKPAADCPDGPRYKALGNSMAVPVMRWIGQRIAAVLEAA